MSKILLLLLCMWYIPTQLHVGDGVGLNDTMYSTGWFYRYNTFRLQIRLLPPDSTWFKVESGNYYMQRQSSLIWRQEALKLFEDSLVDWGSWYSNDTVIVLRQTP